MQLDLKSQDTYERVKEITGKLEQGIQELFESDRYKEYLNVMSKFHNYSFNNTLLIAMQKPDASLIAGYNSWKNNFGRNVVKGEQGIKIFAPSPYKIKQMVAKTDSAGNPVIGKDGAPITEEREINKLGFKVVSVFDVSQTEGKELPTIGVNELSGDVEQYIDLFKAVENVSPVPVSFEKIESGEKGYYSQIDKRIAINEGMSELQNLKTLIHEIAHAKLHDIDLNAPAKEQADRPDRRTREVQAESIAYTVCQHYNLDTADYSFTYVASWSSGKDIQELKSSLDTIRKTASELISEIEEQLNEIQNEREMMQKQEKESLLLVQNSDVSKYSLVSVTGMSTSKIVEELSVMSDDDKLNIVAYLENKGGYPVEIANEKTTEFGEYRIDVRYNTDTNDIIDFTAEKIGSETKSRDSLHDEKLVSASENAEPTVTILWSEHSRFHDGETMSLSEANSIMENIDKAVAADNRYYKTKFRIDFVMNGQPDNYIGRQDLGDGEGTLISHIESYHTYYENNEQWGDYLLRNKGMEALEADKAYRDMLLHEFVPYLKLHNNLSQMEQNATKALQENGNMTPIETAYHTAIQEYVSKCRTMINSGDYNLPSVPQLKDFDTELAAYKEHVEEEIAQEAAAAGMTVDEYAANGYEPYSAPENVNVFTPKTIYIVHPYKEESGRIIHVLSNGVTQENGPAKLGSVLYKGTKEACDKLMNQLYRGEITENDVKNININKQSVLQNLKNKQNEIQQDNGHKVAAGVKIHNNEVTR